ncbi:MAG: T9SS type A sorting domain-containing protein, partial [candidate division Zixibacteria bacterium]|nr:T9SS type A sorting domain-containing protein [candidate division Zixibacteria bacterium]
GDFDADGLLELYMPSNDQRLYCWDLPTVASDSAVVWGSFLHDKRHSGTLPFARPAVQPRPRPPVPSGYRLAQNYPNPFNQNTVIEVDLPQTGDLAVDVFNILGQRVATVYHGTLDAGFYHFDWNGAGYDGQALASGIYFYRLRIGNQTETRKMVLLK